MQSRRQIEAYLRLSRFRDVYGRFPIVADENKTFFRNCFRMESKAIISRLGQIAPPGQCAHVFIAQPRAVCSLYTVDPRPRPRLGKIFRLYFRLQRTNFEIFPPDGILILHFQHDEVFALLQFQGKEVGNAFPTRLLCRADIDGFGFPSIDGNRRVVTGKIIGVCVRFYQIRTRRSRIVDL